MPTAISCENAHLGVVFECTYIYIYHLLRRNIFFFPYMEVDFQMEGHDHATFSKNLPL